MKNHDSMTTSVIACTKVDNGGFVLSAGIAPAWDWETHRTLFLDMTVTQILRF